MKFFALALGLGLFLGIPGLAYAQADSAACALRAGESLLLVQGGPANKWALPGGYAKPGETPEQTARRETFEETGLRVRAVQKLDLENASPGFRLYACEAQAPLSVAGSRVAILEAPHLGRESAQAGLFDSGEIQTIALRFPTQVQALMPHLKTLPESPTRRMAVFPSKGFRLHEMELPWIEAFVKATAGWASFFRFGNFFGELWFYLLCLPFLAWKLGWRHLYRMTLGLVGLSAIVNVLKPALALPRPFHYLPGLSLQGASGFGMPSGHTFGALFFFGSLALWMSDRVRLRISLPLALALAIWTGASRVWLGVHFFSDVLAGLILGAIFLVFLHRREHGALSWTPREISSRTWLLLGLASLAGGLVFMQEKMLHPIALCLGAALGKANRPPSSRASFPETLGLLFGTVLLGGSQAWLLRGLEVFWQQALATFIACALLGWWLRSGASSAAQILARRRPQHQALENG